MTARVLPTYEPRIRARLHHSLPQSIMTDDADYLAWFHSNYIQLYCNRGPGGSVDVNFFEYFMWDHPYPPIQAQKLRRRTLELMGTDLIDFIVKCIDDGLYFYTYMDEYYVPLILYREHHYVRDILVFGYDLQARQLDVLGMKQGLELGRAKVSFEEFLEGYNSMAITADYQQDVFLLRQRPHIEFAFDPKLVGELAEDYLHSRNTSARYRMFGNPAQQQLFGFDVHDRYLEDLRLAQASGEVITLVPAHTFCEHKLGMQNRVQYMVEQGFVSAEAAEPVLEAYRPIVKGWMTVRNMIVKRFLSGNTGPIDKMIDSVAALRSSEVEALEKLLKLVSPL